MKKTDHPGLKAQFTINPTATPWVGQNEPENDRPARAANFNLTL